VVPLRVLTVARVAVLLLLASSVALHGPIRYRRLAADARTVDEVQVAMARTLARGPVQQVVWASDGGGALQYFSRGTVIDLSGANTHALRAPDAQAFLDAHRPDFIEIVAKLSSIDDAPARQFRALSFTATASDTITGASEQRWLVACTDTPRPERLHLGERVFGFRCGGGPRASSMPSALATVTLNSRSP
jgi:hypothetical protein